MRFVELYKYESWHLKYRVLHSKIIVCFVFVNFNDTTDADKLDTFYKGEPYAQDRIW